MVENWKPPEGVPNPGSDAALAAGCHCPVMDNWRGSDEIGRIRGFVVVEGCPVHPWTFAGEGNGPAEAEEGAA